MNICSRRFREIIVDHRIDTFEVHATGNNISGNQDPGFSRPEVINSMFSLYQFNRIKENPQILHICKI